MHDSIVVNICNGPLYVGSITLTGISSSSSLLIGDTESLQLHSFFDTPPESVIVGATASLSPPPEEDAP
jgi:spore germination protein PD